MPLFSPLVPGDRVALIAPASPVSETEKIEGSLGALAALGLVPQLYPSAASTAKDYLSLSDEERAADLNRAFSDPAIRGVFCIRGGYGCMRILDRLDYGAIARDPKLFLGLSDITALHLAIYRKTGLVTLHAPMPFRYGELPEAAYEHLKNLLFRRVPARFDASRGIRALFPGRAEGILIGGNLTLVSSLLASEYLPDLSGAILFLEDVGETPYRIDRVLTALKLAHVFDRVSGVIFGGFTDCGDEARILRALRSTVPETLPCVTGFPAGHLQENYGFYHGARVVLDADRENVEWE